MKKTFAALFSLTLISTAWADQWGRTLGDRVRNPWFIMLGSFAGNSELGTIFNSSNFQFSNCPGAQPTGPDLAVLESLGLELGLGFDVALAPVDFRFSSRVQTFGLTNNESLARPHSVFGVDALFRSNQVYFGPGIGIGYASARTSGLTFQGVPTQVLSAVVGYDTSETAFAEARLQTAPANDYKVASISFGLRF